MIKKFFEYYSNISDESYIKDLLDDFEDLEFVEIKVRKVFVSGDLNTISHNDIYGLYKAYVVKFQLDIKKASFKNLMELYQKIYQFELRIENRFDFTKSIPSHNEFTIVDSEWKNVKFDPVLTAKSEFSIKFPNRFLQYKGNCITYGRVSHASPIYRKETDDFSILYEGTVSLRKHNINLRETKRMIDLQFPKYEISISSPWNNGTSDTSQCNGFVVKFEGLKKTLS